MATATSDTYRADVRQYLRPDGRIVDLTIDLPVSTHEKYLAMREAGCRLEAEILTTGEVSLAVSDGGEDIDIEIVSNGPFVKKAIVAMLERRSWRR